MNKSYLVLSVTEIKELLAAAEASRDAFREVSDPQRDCHCVVLRLRTSPEHTNDKGEEQVTTDSMIDSLAEIRLLAASRGPLGAQGEASDTLAG